MTNLSQERKFEPEEEAIMKYLASNRRANTKEITENVEELPKNRAIVENYLTKLFFKDEISMAKEGRARVWSKNHITVNFKQEPLFYSALQQDTENYGRRKIWFDLYPSPRGGPDYIYIQDSRFVEGEGWINKGGIVVSLDMLSEFVANLLKVALRSDGFTNEYPTVSKQLESFVKEISLHTGVKSES